MSGKSEKFGYGGLLLVLLVFLLFTVIVMAERAGIRVTPVIEKSPYPEREDVLQTEDAMAGQAPSCLLITDLGIEGNPACAAELSRMLLDMRVPTELVDLGSEAIPDDLTPFSSFVIATPYISALEDRLLDLCDRVHAGCGLLIAAVPEPDSAAEYLLRKSGCILIGSERQVVDAVYFSPEFLLGGGQTYAIPNPYDCALRVSLRESAEVCARSGDENGPPLIWSSVYGAGRIAAVNLGISEKAFRGFYAMSYTLIEDVSVYPVLDGMLVFLDDMPSPVPEGRNEYITRDYGVSVSEFYVNHWFPNISTLSRKYGFPLVGLIVENYESDVDGTADRQTDEAYFHFFGNQILRAHGELGYHGYNHQPLTTTIDYQGKFEYRPWDSIEAVRSSFAELMAFSRKLYPDAVLSCYVPPSNILSKEGRAFIGSLYPAVRTVSGVYLEDNDVPFAYVTEFCAARDGIAELPRITSGSVIDPYMRLAALSELNMHMVFSHFLHPDDALDIDRGAELGWETMYRNLDGFFGWAVGSAPMIRRVNSAELSGTIQRWSGLTVEKVWGYDKDKKTLTVNLGNYLGEAHLFCRFNEGIPSTISGGSMEKMTDSLYLLHADRESIVMRWEE